MLDGKDTSEYGLHIIEQTGSLKPEYEGDKMLLEAFMQNGYKGKELRELNKSRLYLHCVNLTDITNSNSVPPISIDRTKAVRMANTTSPKSTTEVALEESAAQMLHPTPQNQCPATTFGCVALNTQPSHQIRP
jgi:hypothetical protein